MCSPQPQSSPWCILLLRHERSPVPSLLGIWKYNKNSPSGLEILLREAVTQGWSYAGEFFSENFSCPFQPSELSRQALHLKSGSSSCTATCSERQCLGHGKGESIPLWGSDTPLSSVLLLWPSTLHGYQETRGAAFVKTRPQSRAGAWPLEEPARSQVCRRAVGQEALHAWQGGGLLYQKHPRLLGEATAIHQELQIMRR